MSDKEESSFPKRLEKKLPTGFQEAVQSMDTDEIKSKLYETQAHLYEIDKAKDADENLAKAREEVKMLLEPYKDAAATENAKVKFCFCVLESRGVKITP